MLIRKNRNKRLPSYNILFASKDLKKKKYNSLSLGFIRNVFPFYDKKKRGNKSFELFRGFGATCSYEWIECDENVEVKIRISPDINSDDIQYNIKSNYIYFKIRNKPKSLIEGKLKGSVDVNFSTWFLEKQKDCNILNIVLKKKSRGINEWVGVVEKENIVHVSYDNLSSSSTSSNISYMPSPINNNNENNNENNNNNCINSYLSNELLYSQYFENAKFNDIFDFLINWASKKSSSQKEFGIPILKLKTNVIKNEDSIEIILTGYDSLKWEAEDSIIFKLGNINKGVSLNIYRGNIASGLKGTYGSMISYLVQESEERIIRKLQHDIKGLYYLNPLTKNIQNCMHTQSPQSSYSYRTDEKDVKHISINEEDNKKVKDDSMNKNFASDHNNEANQKHIHHHHHHNNNNNRVEEIKKDSDQEDIIIKELQLSSTVKLSCEDKSKEPSFMKDWSEEKKIEFRRNSVLELKKNLELTQENKLSLRLEDYISHMKNSFDLTDEESKLVWQKGIKKTDEQKNREKFYRFTEIENLTEKIGMFNVDEEDIDNFSNMHYERIQEGARRDSDTNYTNDTKSENNNNDDDDQNSFYDVTPNITNSNNINQQFYNCLEKELLDTQNKKQKTLYEIYIQSNDKEKKEMREKWRVNEMRLNTLIDELKYLDDNIIPTVCNNYRDVLLSDEYPCLMKIRLYEKPPQNQEEKKILQIVNSFVMSLYDDIKILMEHEEKEHLKKIQLICEKVIQDEKGLNEFIESMKPLLDYSFLGYIKHAIQMEKKNIQAQKKDFRQHPSDWLIILMIIQKGIYTILEKDIWQDVINISAIICHDNPAVRKTILTTMIASMAKADWIFFKDIIKTLYKSVEEKKLTANHFPDFPHIPEAIFQLNYDIEQILPDWFIKEMLDEYDKSIVEQMKSKKPLFWKMKEIKWDPKFVNNFKTLQLDSNNYNGNILSNKNKVKHFKCPKCNNNISTDTVSFNCEVCKALFNIDIFRNFNIFELFNIEVNYDIDKSHLKKKFNEIQNIYHPDKNAQNVEVDEINEVSSYLNNAYKTLSNDVERALYLLKMEYNYMISEDECMDDDEFLSEIIKVIRIPRIK
ncbi:Fe-S protein assembly co-chaperone HscB, variant 2 [Plasmodium falciparum Santa Lucia]|uniref:NudC domain-containing protein 1 n=1 Tax=Plasmodium falciparum Santa Lucia TaxID=478859 RepID=W7FJF3_PLAFA|nr:Fe-S protein assembly co-chaperone HscB, variant 2 [Plasmodium falciparum Santa Lucia]